MSLCLALAAPLAASAVNIQSQQLREGLHAQPNYADKVSYPALMATVAACQLSTAAALADSSEAKPECTEIFALFWGPVCPW